MIFSVEVPVAGTAVGLKLALVRGGKPMTLRFTVLEPLTAVTVTVVDLFEPRGTVSGLGDAERLKSGVLVDPPAVKEAIAVLQLKLKNPTSSSRRRPSRRISVKITGCRDGALQHEEGPHLPVDSKTKFGGIGASG